ncbi:unnamed protein product [marine sediment metagenome]|uniref:Major facilitator superfamily (MFS) profile domain-containing protein n=1 Tax=marine sediment metagenome TaxID=412755 RepID=X1NJ52_9ZZZZ
MVVMIAIILTSIGAVGVKHTEKFHQMYTVKPGTKIEVYNINGKIEINKWDKNEVEVNAMMSTRVGKDELKKVKIEVTMNGDMEIRTKYLDYNEMLFKPLFAIVGVFGYLGILALRRIRVDIPEMVKDAKSHPVISPIITTIYEFRNNKPFLWYEIGFMIYGFGYMMVLPILPQFLVNKLGMTYTQISIGKVMIAYSGVALFSPLAGFIHKKLNPIIFSGLSFIVLGFYPLLINLSIFQNILDPILFVYIGFGVFSIGMAGVFINF